MPDAAKDYNTGKSTVAYDYEGKKIDFDIMAEVASDKKLNIAGGIGVKLANAKTVLTRALTS